MLGMTTGQHPSLIWRQGTLLLERIILVSSIFSNNILWGQITGRSKSRLKSRRSAAKRSSPGVHEFTAKKHKGESMTLPSTSPKETTHHKEWLQQRERESMLIEEDGKFKNEYLTKWIF